MSEPDDRDPHFFVKSEDDCNMSYTLYKTQDEAIKAARRAYTDDRDYNQVVYKAVAVVGAEDPADVPVMYLDTPKKAVSKKKPVAKKKAK